MREEIKPGEERHQKIWDLIYRDLLEKNRLLQGYGRSGVTEGQYINDEPGRLVVENGKVIESGIESRITEEAGNCLPEDNRYYSEEVTGDRRYFLPENRDYYEGLLHKNKQADEGKLEFCRDHLKRLDKYLKLKDEKIVSKERRKEIESLKKAMDNEIV